MTCSIPRINRGWGPLILPQIYGGWIPPQINLTYLNFGQLNYPYGYNLLPWSAYSNFNFCNPFTNHKTRRQKFNPGFYRALSRFRYPNYFWNRNFFSNTQHFCPTDFVAQQILSNQLVEAQNYTRFNFDLGLF